MRSQSPRRFGTRAPKPPRLTLSAIQLSAAPSPSGLPEKTWKAASKTVDHGEQGFHLVPPVFPQGRGRRPVHGQMVQHRQDHAGRILPPQIHLFRHGAQLDAADQFGQGLGCVARGEEAQGRRRPGLPGEAHGRQGLGRVDPVHAFGTGAAAEHELGQAMADQPFRQFDLRGQQAVHGGGVEHEYLQVFQGGGGGTALPRIEQQQAPGDAFAFRRQVGLAQAQPDVAFHRAVVVLAPLQLVAVGQDEAGVDQGQVGLEGVGPLLLAAVARQGLFVEPCQQVPEGGAGGPQAPLFGFG